jgi:hypothetical protein
MRTERAIQTARRRPVRAVLIACSLLSLTGCGEGGGLIAGAIVSSAASHWTDDGRRRHHSSAGPAFEGDPNWVQVKTARLRSTPGGCEVDVTFTNVTTHAVSAGFEYDVLDAAGRVVTSRDTAVQLATPGETRTVSSEGTTAGPSGVPCPPGRRARLTEVSVFNF